MKRPPVHYFVHAKNRHHGEAIAEGFAAAKVPAEHGRLKRGALHLVGGLQHGSLALMQQLRANGEPYVFFDRAYFGGGPGTDWLRAVPNAYQKHWVEERPTDRLERLGVTLEPWRTGGRYVLLVPPGKAICALFGLQDWLGTMLQRLKRRGWPVDLSIKGDPRPLADRFADCRCVVTFTSNVAVEAICAGVPAICSPLAAAAPMAGSVLELESAIENPPRPPREAWAASLAYGQFSLGEIRSGHARAVVMGDA